MTNADASRQLPERPSAEYLRKQAKRLGRERGVTLSEAQRLLAFEYGEDSWSALMQRVRVLRGDDTAPAVPALSRLSAAARAGEFDAVQSALAAGDDVEGAPDDRGTPLWHACDGGGSNTSRIAIVKALLAAGANPRRDDAGETPLHAAVRGGPLSLVERLIRGGALVWQRVFNGPNAVDVARDATGPDADAIRELLDRPVIRDPQFRDAVQSLQRGDAARLAKLLDAEPRLLRDRIVEPECYRDAPRRGYFDDPKLFWFIANNPTLMTTMPANIVEIAQLMIDRGVAREDLDYTLELVMSSGEAQAAGVQIPLMHALLAAGATPSAHAIDIALAHRVLAPVQVLLDRGHPVTESIAAAFGSESWLRDQLPNATADEIQRAFAIAVINGQIGAARLALKAGADIEAPLVIHSHSRAVHQAATDGNLAMLEMLVERGARTDVPDTLWHGSPLGWAERAGHEDVIAFLRAREAG